MTTARVVYFAEPGEVGLREDDCPEPDAGQVSVRTEHSAISPGTELLIYRGEADADLQADPTIDALPGTLEFPLSYGYACVGRVTGLGSAVDSSWLDRRVFVFHPHASRFVVDVEALHPVPDGCSTAAATLLPTVETAVNLVLDARPLLGERAVVFGQGPVGLTTTAVLEQFPLGSLHTVERLARRRELSVAFGADGSVEDAGKLPTAVREEGADLTVELTGDPSGLDAAIATTGFDGRVIVGSWYGQRAANLELDGRFHRSRINLEASQVSTIAPRLRGRWSTQRRLDVAWECLRSLDTDRLITHEFPLEEAAAAYELLDHHPEEAVQVLLSY